MRILIADDHLMVLEGLRPALTGLAEAITIVECGNFDEALAAASTGREPAVAILDLRMPGMNGVDGVRTFRSRFPDMPVVVLSGYYRQYDILKAFQYGAAGFIPKSVTLENLLHALRLVLSGGQYVPVDVLSNAHDQRELQAGNGFAVGMGGPLRLLTPREREVLDLLMEGQSNKEIAWALRIQEVTVKLHMRNTLRKLGAANRAQAVRIALQCGWESTP